MEARVGDERTFTVRDDDAGRRLDRVLRKLLPRCSLDRIYTALRKGEVNVDGTLRQPSYRLRAGERIRLGESLAIRADPVRRRASGGPAVDLGSLVVYRTRHFVVFDKPRGLPVHGERSLATLAGDLLLQLSEPSLSFRPGPVHRLDRDTSGVVLFALSLAGARELSRLLRERACEKTYLALLQGTLETEETWVDTLRRDREIRRTVADRDGEPAAATVVPLVAGPACTLARIRIETGRTHQIRAQASLRARPLVGDTRYGGAPDPDGYVLHSALFRLPAGCALAERTTFVAPVPPLSRAILERHLEHAAVERALRLFWETQGVTPP